MFLSKYWARVCRYMPDELYLQWQFYHIYHRKLNIKNPKTYADKLAYLKMYRKDPLLSKLVDKYSVREYISNKIGAQYLIPLIGLYNSVDDIPWEHLPPKYVLKCTHDSASVILHQSDKGFDRKKAIESLQQNMNRNMFWYSREYPYKDVIPRIVCERFLEVNGKPPEDYKFMCFNGEPHFIVLDIDRFGDHRRDIYDIKWEKQNVITDHENSVGIAPKPKKLDDMLNLARILSNGFAHVRVDFYYFEEKIYFGEMTFFPWGGPIWFKPDEWNYKLGALIHL